MGRPPTVSSLSGRDFQAEAATYLSARGVWTVDRLPNGGDFQACDGAGGRPHALVSSMPTRRQVDAPIVSWTFDGPQDAYIPCSQLRCLMSKMNFHPSATCGVQISPSWVGKQQIGVVAPSAHMCGPRHVARFGGPVDSVDRPCTCKAHRDA